ncbi:MULTISPECIES: prephenate dehydrogenase [unclassified Streptomyces]|uniref:prephenate dehydrogenase n=1 Tax=unclassified Streptomyces TaxID=2593676 RepID=UPI002DDB3E08|nr:prephenate dehydrogenase [Streptomyces sp. NBC_01257]WRZ63453.1 prephenate dehydrogenase [Streptomyces sp. NBC_01257]WSU57417.1 prephenate dehydrogenase [Streptomyces sp. NBC_01104]
MRSALVIGTGVIGTSVGLALRAQAVTVHLRDVDATAVRTAAALGAGLLEAPSAAVDLAIIAVPPARVGAVLAEAQAHGVARHYTDVASVKAEPAHHAAAFDCDLTHYVGGHPMVGSARSGPLPGRADLFEWCTWALTPTATTTTETLNTALDLVASCGAVPVVLDAGAHDRAVGLTSHTPHVLASLVARRLLTADERAADLARQPLRDLTRTAEADPRMWLDVLSANAAVVADLLDELGADVAEMAAGLRSIASTDEAKRRAGADLVETMLVQARAGRARISGKHGARPERFEVIEVVVGDQPGELARLFTHAGRAGVNIEDIRIEHVAGHPAGVAHVSVLPGHVEPLRDVIRARGWRER